jgi:hypothetical protein
MTPDQNPVLQPAVGDFCLIRMDGGIWRMWSGWVARNITSAGFNAASAVGAAYL